MKSLVHAMCAKIWKTIHSTLVSNMALSENNLKKKSNLKYLINVIFRGWGSRWPIVGCLSRRKPPTSLSVLLLVVRWLHEWCTLFGLTRKHVVLCVVWRRPGRPRWRLRARHKSLTIVLGSGHNSGSEEAGWVRRSEGKEMRKREGVEWKKIIKRRKKTHFFKLV